jgi:ribonucleotide monophosphatase NagD (HAD superfamily)
MVGDRLDTDIALAHAMGSSSLLVFTGVATADDLLTELGPSRASHDERAPLPTHAVSHVGHLLELCEQN